MEVINDTLKWLWYVVFSILFYNYGIILGNNYNLKSNISIVARRAGSDGGMSASGSAGPGFDPRQSSKF